MVAEEIDHEGDGSKATTLPAVLVRRAATIDIHP